MDRTERSTVEWEQRRAAVLAGLSHRDLLALALHLARASTPWTLADSIDLGKWHHLRPIAAEALYPVRVSIQTVPEDSPAGEPLF
jgi:hypothetical protein